MEGFIRVFQAPKFGVVHRSCFSFLLFVLSVFFLFFFFFCRDVALVAPKFGALRENKGKGTTDRIQMSTTTTIKFRSRSNPSFGQQQQQKKKKKEVFRLPLRPLPKFFATFLRFVLFCLFLINH